VVAIEQGSGYSGDLCTPGSQEYVRFYLSFDGGATWLDQGMVSFTAHDTGTSEELEYDVTLVITPPQQPCATAELPRVRAILSWNQQPPPNSPDWPPVWGDVKEATIQIAPAPPLAVVETAGLDALTMTKIESVLSAVQKPAVEFSKLHADYQGKVGAHRYLFPTVKQVESKLLSAEHLAQTTNYLAALGIDLGKAISQMISIDGDTSFEELTCVGYNLDARELVGVLTVKQSNGYSGGLCSAGSQEYVSFWRDAGGGAWDFLGTTVVGVHDISPLPSGGLQYAAFLRWDPLTLQQPCTAGLTKARIRAVLSWSTPATSPTVPPTWGNHVDAEVQINPGDPVKVGEHPPYIESAGGMVVSLIDGFGIANGTMFVSGAPVHDAPFGGRVTIAGTVANLISGASANYEYRIAVTDDSSNTEQLGGPLNISVYDPASTAPPTAVTVTPTLDTSTGYYWYAVQEDLPSRRVVGDILYQWDTGAKMGRYRIFMEVRDKTTLATWPLATNVYVKLNNSPLAYPTVVITSGSGPCGDFHVGDEISGTYQAFEPYCGGISIDIQPPDPALPYGIHEHLLSSADPPYTAAHIKTGGWYRNYTGGLPGGVPTWGEDGYWLIETNGLSPCGYIVELWMSDRTIWDSAYPGRTTRAVAGFCLRAKTS
jgi:hypothetical protein